MLLFFKIGFFTKKDPDVLNRDSVGEAVGEGGSTSSEDF